MEKSSALTESMVKADTSNPEYPAVPKNPPWCNGALAMIVYRFDRDRCGYFLNHILFDCHCEARSRAEAIPATGSETAFGWLQTRRLLQFGLPKFAMTIAEYLPNTFIKTEFNPKVNKFFYKRWLFLLPDACPQSLKRVLL